MLLGAIEFAAIAATFCVPVGPLSPCVGPGQVVTPGGVSPPASTGGAAQTKGQAGVTGNACCLVGEGGEAGNLSVKNYAQYTYAVLLAVYTNIYAFTDTDNSTS